MKIPNMCSWKQVQKDSINGLPDGSPEHSMRLKAFYPVHCILHPGTFSWDAEGFSAPSSCLIPWAAPRSPTTLPMIWRTLYFQKGYTLF